ncbi:MAG: TonB-dependent receptor [Sphaerochaetaceae bacterium]|nr:TonB-dependent receptor [Sphaerochaetaceae bacterium]
MKKRGIFSLVLLLTISSLYAAEAIADLGTAFELVIASAISSDAQTNSSSSVSVISQEQIEAYHAQTTAELVGKAIGTSFNSVGSLGAMQNVVIRGATSSKNLIYLDGVPLSSAHDGSFDLSAIPVDIVERIEIIKSGPGNLGRTNAIGGIVNIITKKGVESQTPFSVSFENGSFIPSLSSEDLLSILDSQKLDIAYANNEIIATVGGQIAQNAYTYDNGTATEVRDNAQLYEGHGSFKVDTRVNDTLSFQSRNLFSYRDLGVPGGLVWGLTAEDKQKALLAGTHNTFILDDPADVISELQADMDYTYGRTFFHDADYQDSIHNTHKGSVQLSGIWNLSERYTLTTGALYSLDYVDSTDVGKNSRQTVSGYAHAGIYSSDGQLSIFPSLNIAYLSDLATLSPNASLGALYTINGDVEVRATVSYAERTPTFSELYWPFMSNPDLETEKGWNGDVGVAISRENLSYEGTLFIRDIYNAITYETPTYLPANVAHSFYLGTEQSVSVSISEDLSAQVSYQYNRSFDLSGGQTLRDDVEVTHVRKHTVKGAIFLSREKYDLTLSGEYLGGTSTLNEALLINVSGTYRVHDTLSLYAAVDNLLNTSYELTGGGYPMPGVKVRLGGDVRL